MGEEPDAAWVLSSHPRHAHLAGFDLHANVAVSAADRTRLEPLCRYLLRPPVVQDRLRRMGDDRILLTLNPAWADGTSHLVFAPMELLEKLAALTPHPRINLILCHGWRRTRDGAPGWWSTALTPRRRSRVTGRGRTSCASPRPPKAWTAA